MHSPILPRQVTRGPRIVDVTTDHLIPGLRARIGDDAVTIAALRAHNDLLAAENTRLESQLAALTPPAAAEPAP